MPLQFDQYAQKGKAVVQELADQLGIPDQTATAGRLLRAVLHALRNRLSVDENMQLLAQLPMALKGIYVDGWNIHKPYPRIKHVNEFISEVIHEDYPTGRHDITNSKDGENAIRATFIVLENHLSAGEVKALIHVLPTELKHLWQGYHEQHMA